MNRKAEQEEDFVSEQFKRESKDAPLIKLGSGYHNGTRQQKIRYLHKMASAYHHAAIRLQEENIELNEILFNKEAIIHKLEKSNQADREMIHRTIDAENKAKQKLLKENEGLYAEIKQLEARLADGD
jgi:hypothetical protein